MTFNCGENFAKAKSMGSVKQDLNNYKCPECGSPYFLKGQDSYQIYTQCLKSDCLRVDIIGPDLNGAKVK